jgi:hypothetical protein
LKAKPEVEGELLHAKHALQPNSLGYCGPDENATILDHLHSSSVSEDLTTMLTKFEAAYPFVRMIAKSTGRSPFDKEVTEAYWIGNSLLDRVEPSDFYQFTHQGLGKRMKKPEAKKIFREVGGLAKPHHTFYVLGMYSRSNIKTANQSKLLELMDSCRVSWGRVLDIKRDTLVVARSPLSLVEDRLALTRAEKKEVRFDPQIPPFSSIRKGDYVSLHWNFASERLSAVQLRNLRSYTAKDIEATNRIVASSSSSSPSNRSP